MHEFLICKECGGYRYVYQHHRMVGDKLTSSEPFVECDRCKKVTKYDPDEWESL